MKENKTQQQGKIQYEIKALVVVIGKVSTTVVKYRNQKQHGEEGFVSSCTSQEQSITDGTQGRNSRQEHGGKNGSRSH